MICRKLVLLMFVIVIFINMLSVGFRIDKARAKGTIYIRVSGNVEGTTKILRDGDTYTFTDNINDSIVIEKDNVILDGAGYTLQGSGSGSGISLTGVSNVTIRNVYIKTFENGIWLNCSSHNSIIENNIQNNKRGIFLYFFSNFNIIAGNHMTTSYMSGILLFRSSNNSIVGNNMTTNTYEGIKLEYSSNNTIAENNITANVWEGLLLHVSSNNTITGNKITTNDDNGVVLQYYSNYNSVVGNNISTNRFSGIYLGAYSNFNTIAGNNISTNKNGAYLWQASNNTIYENNITSNDLGMEFLDSSNNSIYHNNFVNNKLQVYDDSWNNSYTNPSVNIWDLGYPFGGNYWSDYREKYPNATEIDDSGLWNIAYVIDGNNQDNYPIIPEFSSAITMLPFMIATLSVAIVYKRKHVCVHSG